MSLAGAIDADSDRLVAYIGEEPVRIGALRLLCTGTAEIKRMYVVRGPGVPRRRRGQHERAAGEANGMYLAAGFRRIGAYNSNPRSDRWYEKPLA